MRGLYKIARLFEAYDATLAKANVPDNHNIKGN